MRTIESTRHVALLGTTAFDELTEDQAPLVQQIIADAIDREGDREYLVVHADDAFVGRSVALLQEDHDEIVHWHSYSLEGEVVQQYRGHEQMMGVTINAHRLIVLEPWVPKETLQRLWARSRESVAQARDIAMLASAVRAGATVAVSIDGKWHPSQAGTVARTVAKQLGLRVVRLVIDRADGDRFTVKEVA